MNFKEYINELDANVKTKDVHISTIKWGDIVIIDGDTKTVGKKDIITGGLLGTTLWGDSYNNGKKLVKKVVQIGLRKL